MRSMLRKIHLALLTVVAACSGRDRLSGSPEARREQIEKREAKTSTPGEALDRKHRSEALLATEGVPILPSLPVIESEAESRRRTKEEVTQRAVGVIIVASRGLGLSQRAMNNMIDHFDAETFFTPKERVFRGSPASSQQELAQFSWRFEAACVLMWALGYIDELGRPDHQCDPERVSGILIENGPAIFQRARLRPQHELLDAADLIYRYDWAVVEARRHNRPMPAGLDPDVVVERHHALNWLIGYADQEWDDISTDT